MQKSRFYQPSHGGTFAVSFPRNTTVFCVRVYLRVTLPLHNHQLSHSSTQLDIDKGRRRFRWCLHPKLVLPQLISETVAATDLRPPLSFLSLSRVLLLIPASYFNICLSFLSYSPILIALPSRLKYTYQDPRTHSQ